MTSSFGARLRQHREERGIPLGDIAGQTKIKLSLLEGLERDDLAHWPPGIFRRAYVRAYALAVGLNPDAIVSEFLSIYPERPEIVDPEVIAQEMNASSNGGAPTRLRHLFGSAVGSLSRLRRGPNADERMQPQGTTGSSAVLGISHPPPVAHAPRGIDDARRNDTARVAVRLQDDDAIEPELELSTDEIDAVDEAPDPAESKSVAPANTGTSTNASGPEIDLLAAADLCTALGRVENASQMPPLLCEAARILGALGLIVWVWDSIADELQPALVYGYSDQLVAQLPRLKPEADNVTAAAFRSAETLALSGSADVSAALAIPLLTPAGCAGVLAIELPPGHEEVDPVRAVAIVFAAMLSQLVGGAPAASSRPSGADGSRPASPFSTAV